MKKKRPTLVTLLTTALMLLSCCTSANPAAKNDPAPPEDPGLTMTADVALARPVGAAATITGFALFLVSSPFSLLGGNAGEAWDNLVAAPAAYTFKRPLGHFEDPAPKEAPHPPAPGDR